MNHSLLSSAPTVALGCLAKLQQLRLPDLEGKAMLDLQAQDGCFCGFALYAKAARVVGYVQTKQQLKTAATAFPQGSFCLQPSTSIPTECFDIILALGVLAPTEAVQDWLAALMQQLTPEGVLVLEVQAIASAKSEWLEVTINGKQGNYPSTAFITQLLKPYAWKMLRTEPITDTTASYLYQLSPRKPKVYLLMQPSAYGKSSIASELFQPAGVPVVNIDSVLNEIALGQRLVPEELYAAVVENYSTLTLGATYKRIFERAHGALLLDVLLAQPQVDLCLDGYIPQTYQAEVVAKCKALGYLPIVLQWDKPQAAPMSRTVLGKKLEAYKHYLSGNTKPKFQFFKKKKPLSALGHVDQIGLLSDGIVVAGWAINSNQHLPKKLVVQIGHEQFTVSTGNALERLDVQQHFDLAHPWVGYSIMIKTTPFTQLQTLLKSGFAVRFLNGKALGVSRSLRTLIS